MHTSVVLGKAVCVVRGHRWKCEYTDKWINRDGWADGWTNVCCDCLMSVTQTTYLWFEMLELMK